ncbi:MAG: alpha/beta fold hydrolase [Bacillota bacterium]|nr:alpha/beta fold hydrolase [Bacillota bacterium]MDW7730525.1 alpha/beta fold hydrolase [Bacillota bacterium]
MPGAEPFFYKSGRVGCLLIHGISGSPQVFRSIGKYLSSEGVSALGVLLKGHGTRLEEMHSCTHEDWITSAMEGLTQLEKYCTRVFCAGLSMGGVLSLRLASLYPERVKGVITICTPYQLRALKFRLVPPMKYLIKKIAGRPPSINDPEAVEINYGAHSIPATHELIKLTALVRQDLPNIKQPALIFGARQDKTVDSRDAGLIYGQIGSDEKELIWLENSQHVAPLDYDRFQLQEKILEFIKGYS